MSQMIKASEAAANQLMIQLRMMSQPHLAQVSGNFVGVALMRAPKNAADDANKNPSWQVFPFSSLQELEDWYGDWLGNESAYAYLAAIDRTQSMDPILEAGFGQRRTRMSNPGAMISGQPGQPGQQLASPGPYDALRELVAKHEVYWGEVAQHNPRNERMRRFMTHEWDPFFRSWVNLVTRHGLSNDDVDVVHAQLQELNRIRGVAFKNEIPVPEVIPTGTDQFVVSGGAVLRPGGHGGFHHGGGGFHRPFPRPRPYGGYPRGFGYDGYYDGYYGDVYEPYAAPVYVLPYYAYDPNQAPYDPNLPQLPAPQLGGPSGGVEVSGWFDAITDKVKSAVSSIRHEVTHPGDLLRHATHAVLHPADSIKQAAEGLGAGAGLAKVISYAADPLQDITENAQVQQFMAARYGGPLGTAALNAANAIDSGQSIQSTMQAFAPQIAQAAASSAAAKAGPTAAKLASTMVNASANTPTSSAAQQLIDQITKAASTNPALKVALDAAHQSVVAAAAAHHVMATSPTPAPAAVSGDHRSPAPSAPPAPAPHPQQTAQHPYGRPTPMPTHMPAPAPAPHPQYQTAQHPYGRPTPAPSSPAPARPRAPAYDRRPAPAPAPYVRDQRRASAPARPSAPYVRDHRSGVPTTRPNAPFVRDHRSSVPTHASAPPPYHSWQAPAPSSFPHHGHRHWGGWGRGGYYRPGARYPGRWVRGVRGPVWFESDQNLLIPDDQPLDFPDMAPPTIELVPLTIGDPNDQTTIVPGDQPGTVVRMDAATDGADGSDAGDQGDAGDASDPGAETGADDNGDVSSSDSGATDPDVATVTQGEIMFTPLSDALIMCGKALAPIANPIQVTSTLSPDKILTVQLCIDGTCYEASADVSQILTGLLSGARTLHNYMHATNSQALVGGDLPPVIALVRGAMVGKIVESHKAAVCAGWFDSITHAVSSAVNGIGHVANTAVHSVGHTLKQFKGPIAAAAGIAAGTAAAAIPGVGPLVAPIAGKLANDMVNAAAGDGDVQQIAQSTIAQAQQVASQNPNVKAALDAAHTAVSQATAGYHVAQTVQNAAAGDQNAIMQFIQLAQAAGAGDAGAKAAVKAAQAITNTAATNATVSGVAGGDPRAIARAAAMATQGNVIGVVIPHDNPIQVKVFASSDDADDWYGQWLAIPHAFEYVAYYDRGDESFPTPLNETIGQRSATKASGFLGGVALPFLSGGATAYLLSKLGQRAAPLARTPEPPAPVVHSLSTAPGTAPGPTGNTTVSGAALFPFLAGVGIGAGGYLGGQKLYSYWQSRHGAPVKASGWNGGRWTAHLESDIGVSAMYGER